jgi:hypothetical protein
MAEGAVNDSNQDLKVINEISINEDTECYDCKQLKLELVKVSPELSSMREIIKILQDKESIIQQPRGKTRIVEQDLDGKPVTVENPYEEWTFQSSRKKFTRRNYGHLKQEAFPIHVNRYNALRTLVQSQIVELPTTHKTMTRKINSETKNKKCSENCRKCRNKRKIIIIGYSNAKGSAANIKQVLGKSIEVIGYVSTGAKLDHLTGMANNEINKITKKDTVVIWGGAIDIANNEADRGLAHLSKFVGECANTKVLVVGAPKRHDL